MADQTKRIQQNHSKSLYLTLVLIVAITAAISVELELGRDLTPGSVNIDDSYENILYGYYVATGQTPYLDFGSNHFPGVYLWLSHILDIFGIDSYKPSPALNVIATRVAITATFFFQGLAIILLAWLTTHRWLYGLFIFPPILKYLEYRRNFEYPLSETYIPFIIMFFPLLLYRAISAKDTEERIKVGATILIPMTFISIFLGLTCAPANIFMAVVGLGMIRWSGLKIILTSRHLQRYLLIISIPCLVIILYTALKVDLKGLFFYNFEFNRTISSQINLFNFITHYRQHFSGHGVGWAFMLAPMTLLLSLVMGFSFLWPKNKQERSYSKFLFFIITVNVAAALTLWRADFGYKTWGLFGLNLGMFISIITYGISRTPYLKRCYFGLRGKQLIALTSIAFVIAGYKLKPYIHSDPLPYSQSDQDFSQLLNEADICPFGVTSDTCKCLRLTHWEPDFYLRFNVSQCKPFGLFTPPIAFHHRTKSRLMQDTKNSRVAFILAPQQQLEFFSVPKDAVMKIRKRNCTSVSERTLCK